MSAQPETLVVRAIIRELKRRGCEVVNMHGSAFSRKGFPDLLVVRPDGVTAYVEVKRPGRTDGPGGDGRSALQVWWGHKMLELGAPYGLADDVPSAVAAVFGRQASGE